MKGIIFNLNNNIKTIDGYNFIINMLKNLNIPWIELKMIQSMIFMKLQSISKTVSLFQIHKKT